MEAEGLTTVLQFVAAVGGVYGGAKALETIAHFFARRFKKRWDSESDYL